MSVQDRRAEMAIALLGGKHDIHLEQFGRIANGEQNPLGQNCFASLDLEGNVVDVAFMDDGRIFIVTRHGKRAALWQLGFPNCFVAGGSRIDLLGAFGDKLFYKKHFSRRDILICSEPQVGTPIKPADNIPISVVPTIHPMADGNFVAVWQVPAGDDSVVFIGNLTTGNTEKYEHFDKFVPLKGGGYVVFWRDVYVGKLTWIKSDGEKFERMLDVGYRGDTAAVINGELWFSEVNLDSNSSRVVRMVDGKGEIVCRGHRLDQLIFDGDRPAVWEKNSGFIEYLAEPNPQARRPFTSTDRSFVPMRFGTWLLFQVSSGGQKRFSGFNDSEMSASPTELRPEGNWDILKIVGDYLLMASTETCWDVFYVFDGRKEWNSRQAVRHLPPGCKAERLRIVGDSVCCWSTVGSTLNLFRIRI